MSNEITRNTTLQWSKGGASAAVNVSEKITQVGNNIIENVQIISDGSEQINLGDVTTPKYIVFKNMTPTWGSLTAAEKVASGFTGNTAESDYIAAHSVHIGNISPADSENTPFKLDPSNGVSLVTAQTSWYAIASNFDVNLLVFAIEG